MVAGLGGEDHAARELAREAAVGHDQDVIRLDRPHCRRDVGVRNPVDRIVPGRVLGEPVALVGVDIQPAVTGVENQQVVCRGQFVAQFLEAAQDVGSRRVDQGRDLVCVVVAKDRRDRDRVVDGGPQHRQVGVAVDPDDQRVVATEVDLGD